MSTPIRVALNDYINWRLLRNMEEAINFAKSQVDSRTPEDTGALIAGNKVISPYIEWEQIKASVVNSVEHAEIVEFWVGKVYNYHKWPKKGIRKVIRTWVGARMMSLTKDIDESKIVAIIQK